MADKIEPGLGELLRHLVELTDGSASASAWYKGVGNLSKIDEPFQFRPRYTPVMRALRNGPESVSDIKAKLSITQGAVSQTIKLMLQDGLIEKTKGEDARQSIINLTDFGHGVLTELIPHWEATFIAIDRLEQDIQLPLRTCLKRSIQALEEQSFSQRISLSKPSKIADKVEQNNNYFETGGDRYAQFRPSYPKELASVLSGLVKNHQLALDVGCGSGQLTSLLAPHFEQVIGTDSSYDQLRFAKTETNLAYLQQSAENISLKDRSVDLITVAQAAHWFDLDRFYEEVRRVFKPGGSIALISYGVPYVEDQLNAVFQKGYWQDTHEFWSPERRHVEMGYTELYFPFEAISTPNLSCRKAMTAEQFIGYISTWSAYTTAKSTDNTHRFEAFFERLRAAWRDELKEVVWPLSLRVGRV